MKKDSLLLYAITDSMWLNGRKLKDDVEKAILGGATMIQLREKSLNDNDFIELAFEIKKVCKKYNVPFIINDNLNVCKAVDADGIHVGQDDLNAKYLREKLGPNKIIGVSARTVEEAKKAILDGANYLGVGAMFSTNTKTDAKVVSVEELKNITSLGCPVVIIGGIKKDNINLFKNTGISGVSVVSAIFAEKDIIESTKKLKEEVLKYI